MNLRAPSITLLQADLTTLWHQEPLRQDDHAPADAMLRLVVLQHRENFDLWHEEDKARDPFASDAEITRTKHAIDGHNQRRNDLVEQIDSTLLLFFPKQNPDAPLHSESPGLIIDRLSILALKIFHTHLETTRQTASEGHRLRNLARLQLLQEQSLDLTACLDCLFTEVAAGTRRFKLYRQMKMYNDPDLNPAVYGRHSGDPHS